MQSFGRRRVLRDVEVSRVPHGQESPASLSYLHVLAALLLRAAADRALSLELTGGDW
jgi:hypothetical protein